MSFDAILAAPFGALGVSLDDDTLIGLEFLPPDTACIHSNRNLIQHIAAELADYYAHPAHVFSLPIAPRGTSFRRSVWRTLMTIPPGQTRSYGEIAQELHSGARAVGQAVGDNPLPLIIPCHRIITAQGRLGGFMHRRSGFSQDIKRWLLAHENAL